MVFIHQGFYPHLPLSKHCSVGTQALNPLASMWKEGVYYSATCFTNSHNLFPRNNFASNRDLFELTESWMCGWTSLSDGDVDNQMTTTVTAEYSFSIESLVKWGGSTEISSTQWQGGSQLCHCLIGRDTSMSSRDTRWKWGRKRGIYSGKVPV